jgi:hypothetical protein
VILERNATNTAAFRRGTQKNKVNATARFAFDLWYWQCDASPGIKMGNALYSRVTPLLFPILMVFLARPTWFC